MSQILFHSPGQSVTLVLETLDGYARADSATLPSINSILFPNQSMASSYPQNMIQLSTGLYAFYFTLPRGAGSIGSYIVDVSWQDPHTGGTAQTYFQVVVTAASGNYGITPG